MLEAIGWIESMIQEVIKIEDDLIYKNEQLTRQQIISLGQLLRLERRKIEKSIEDYFEQLGKAMEEEYDRRTGK